MSTAIAVYHGRFGRVSIYHLDRPMVRHTHREGHLIFHVGGPAERVRMPSGEHPLAPEFGVAVNPWEPHSYETAGQTAGTSMLVIYVNPDWFATQRGGPLAFGEASLAVDDELDRLRGRVTGLLCGHAGAEALEPALFDLVEACFARSLGPAKRTAPGILDFRIRKSLRVLASAVGEEPDLRRVAAESGLSRPHFFKLFHDQVGVPPKLFWNTLRMERALSALISTPLPITQIGLDLGFASSSSFSRFFAANVGLAPIDYRRAARVLAH